MAQEEGLRAEATALAARLRAAGRRVDLVLEPKRMKWAFKQAERCSAGARSGPGRVEWKWGEAAGRGGEAQRTAGVQVCTLCSKPVLRLPACLQPGWCWWRRMSGPTGLCGSRTWPAGRSGMCRWRRWCERAACVFEHHRHFEI